jgi:hypothetical protein
MSRFYFVLFFIILLLLIYWFYHPSSSSNSSNSSNPSNPANPAFKQTLADVNHLPQSRLFTYLNLSTQVFINETQGILFVPPHDRPGHFASIISNGVRGNHRHTDKENSISGEVLILIHGQFQFRIAESDSDKYEDHRFNVSEAGIVALQFTADKCHALKNIGKETNWFASYHIKLKYIQKKFVDKQSCLKMVLT